MFLGGRQLSNYKVSYVLGQFSEEGSKQLGFSQGLQGFFLVTWRTAVRFLLHLKRENTTSCLRNLLLKKKKTGNR